MKRPCVTLAGALIGYLIGLPIGGCANTHVRYGPFDYSSDKLVNAKNVTYTRNKDGSESFHADQLGGDPTAVNAGTVEVFKAAIDRIPLPVVVP